MGVRFPPRAQARIKQTQRLMKRFSLNEVSITQLLLLSLFIGYVFSIPVCIKLYKRILDKSGNESQITVFINELKPYKDQEKIGLITNSRNLNFPKQHYQLQHAAIPTILEMGELPITIFAGFTQDDIKESYAHRVILKEIGPQLFLTEKQL